jgi:hypothetical protein
VKRKKFGTDGAKKRKIRKEERKKESSMKLY